MLRGLFLILLFNSYIFSDECTLKMAYKTINKPPYVYENNKGIYIDLFKKAAQNIGCNLTLIREPKQRVVEDLKSGKVDIYPAFSITKERVKFAHHFKLYIPHNEVLITRNDIPTITNIKQLKDFNLTSAVEKIGYSYLRGLCKNEYETSKLNPNKAILLLLNRRVDVIIAPLITTEYYIHKYNYKGLKIHYNLFNSKNYVQTYGFSRKSKYIKEIPNPNFDDTKEITIENYPTLLDKKSIAYKLQEAIKKLHKEGYIKKLYERYTLK